MPKNKKVLPIPRGAKDAPVKKALRRCLGFGKEHYFMSASKKLRRCRRCEAKFNDANISMRCAEPPKFEWDEQS